MNPKTSTLRSYEHVLQRRVDALEAAFTVIEVAIRAEWTIKHVGDHFEFRRFNGMSGSDCHTPSLDKIPPAVQEWYDSLPIED